MSADRTTAPPAETSVYPDLWVDGADPRESAPDPVGEKDTLRHYLRHYRLTLETKCAGLDAEQMARRSVPPSTMSLLGLVRHLAAVEQSWFRRVLQQDTSAPRLWGKSPETPDTDFDGAVPDPAVVAEAWDAWRREVRAADAWLDALAESDLGRAVPHGDGAAVVREVLVHLVEEYARHCGHADLLRECVDGRVGQ